MAKKRTSFKTLALGLVFTLALTVMLPFGVFASQAEGAGGEAGASPPEAAAPEQQHRVVFHDAGGAVFLEMLLETGTLVPRPGDVPAAPQGQAFAGWYANGALFDFDTAAVQEELALYPGFEAQAQAEPAPQGTVGDNTPEPQPPAGKTGPGEEEAPADPGAQHTVAFMAGGVVYHTETVLHNTLVPPPAPPASESGLPFVGWFYGGAPFAFTTLITEDLVLDARFDDQLYVVQVLDVDGSVLQTYEAPAGQPVPRPGVQPSLMLGEAFLHWYEQDAGVPFAFDEAPTANITLRPALSARAAAVFVSGGGAEVEPQVGEAGFSAANPGAIARNGYEFVHWAAEPNGDTPFNFSAPIHETTYIYAVWQAQPVGYVLNFYAENPDAANAGPKATPEAYELVYTSIIGADKGTAAGETPSIDAAFANARYAEGGAAVQNILDHASLVYVDEKPLAGSGTTVINAYYDRTVYTFNLQLKSNEWIRLRSGALIEGPAVHTVQAKLGQDISQVWPYDFGGINGSKQPINWNSFYGKGTLILSLGYIQKGMGMGRPTQTVTDLSIMWRDASFTETRHYYLETLNGEAGENAVFFTPGGGYQYPGSYYEHAPGQNSLRNYQVGNPKNSAVGWPGRDVPGFETITTNLTKYFQETVLADEQPENGVTDYVIKYYMRRKNYTLTLMTNEGVLSDYGAFAPSRNGAQMTLAYGAPIELPGNPQRDKHEFEGWYYDALYQKPFCPGDAMPAGATTLYAKFRGTEVTVHYRDEHGLVATNTYARGFALDEHELNGTPYDGLQKGGRVPGSGVFQGWFYEPASGLSVEFSPGMQLARDTYTLMARFDPEPYEVTFINVDGDGGYDMGTPLATRRVMSGAKNTLAKSGYTELQPPARENYLFKGWYTNLGMGTRFTTATPVLGNTTVYAVWERERVALAYDANGGIVDAGLARAEVERGASLAESGGRLLDGTDVERPGHVFIGWYTARQGGDAFTESTVLEGDATVYARWQRIDEPVAVTFDGNGGQTNPALLQMQLNKGSSLEATGRATPDARVQREGHVFLGWFTEPEGGQHYTGATAVTEDITVYAHWRPARTDIVGPGTDTTGPGSAAPPEQPGSGVPEAPESGPQGPGASEAGAQVDAQAGGGTTPEVQTLSEQRVPLGSLRDKSSWSLLSLLMALAGAVVSVPLLASSLARKKAQQEDPKAEQKDDKKQRSRLLKWLAAAAGLLAGLLFLILDDISLPVALINRWTPLIALVFVVHLALLAMQFVLRRRVQEEEAGAAA